MKFSYQLIKKLFPKAPPKQKLVEGLNLFSFETTNAAGDVFDVTLPSNRWSDAASHLGIAREAAAVFGIRAKLNIKTFVNLPSEKGFVNVVIKNQKLCPRYAARYFELQSPVRESPKWMRQILASCGIKPINNVVDIMNYVMLETGQPLHAFDADKIADLRGTNADKREKIRRKPVPGRRQLATITVRMARKGEKIKTLPAAGQAGLDGQKFALDTDILVIADKKGPIAIAGIKGGADSGVTERTKRVIVEAANFDAATIYRGARKLKLQSDAALRFSHGISPALVQIGLDRATELLLKEKAWLLDSVDVSSWRATEEVIEFSPQRYEAVVGAPVDPKWAKAKFESLGFWIEPPKKKGDPDEFLVKIPAWRTDIENPEDLIEEIARLKGYGKLRPQAPILSVRPAREEEEKVNLKERVRRILVGLQLDEVYNSSFVGGAKLRGFYADGHARSLGEFAFSEHPSAPVEVENPIAEDKRYLRSSLLPLLLKNIEDNSRFYDFVRIFEIGKIFFAKKGNVVEKLALGVALGAKKEPKLVLEAKGIADELMRGLGIGDFSMVPAGESLRIEVEHNILGIISHAVLEKGWYAAFAEFDLDKVAQFTEEAKEFIPLKRFPSVLRDISILVSPEVQIGDIMQDIQLVNPKLIENVDLIDEYIPSAKENIGTNQRTNQRESAVKYSLTFRVIFQADDRTLTDEEVNREMEKIAAVLKKNYRAEIR